MKTKQIEQIWRLLSDMPEPFYVQYLSESKLEVTVFHVDKDPTFWVVLFSSTNHEDLLQNIINQLILMKNER